MNTIDKVISFLHMRSKMYIHTYTHIICICIYSRIILHTYTHTDNVLHSSSIQIEVLEWECGSDICMFTWEYTHMLFIYIYIHSQIIHIYIYSRIILHTYTHTDNGLHSSSIQIEVLGRECGSERCEHTKDWEGCVVIHSERDSHCLDVVCDVGAQSECVARSCCPK